MLTTIISSIVAFASTNVDDIFILMALFSQIRTAKVTGSEAAVLTKPGLQTRHVVIGQFLGFTSLVALSIIGALSSFFIPVPWIGMLGFVPIYMGVNGLLTLRKSKENDEDVTNISGTGSVINVAAITIANGGDNIAIYIPIFASQPISHNAITLIVFFIMLALWCFLGYALVMAPIAAKVLERYGHVAVPIILIGLGLFILYHSGSFSLLRF
ncbi:MULTISPECIES: cadmium resistance transporter [Sutcliffiella]|uniref:Quaternary ammonium transporter n=1 Tax=Sutcliffiella cohnii TaxID=33932 RepID=A0A223KNE2_9BACI|nr:MULTISPECIES: cadmium resistance transporter [Sutcliffiella]AST91001.1 quaternary ammonium transporter [Sutcliffiella cohnii]WBL16794.1 cadmium resistance transporter [Sutcliffiella sp. NC1]